MTSLTKGTIATILIAIIIGVAAGAIIKTVIIPTIGNILYGNYQLYLDTVAIDETDSIDWGNIEAGYEYQYDNLTCHNNGGKAFTITLTATVPADLEIIWTANNTYLLPTQKCEAPLILNATEATFTTSFNSDLTFQAHD